MQAFTPGFRLSILDVVFVVAGVAATAVVGAVTWWWGLVVGLVIGNFFLFCNVFRIARRLELVWSAIFLFLASGTIVFDLPGWPITVALTTAATIVVVILEMRKPSYHGVGWQWLNPELPAWWEQQRRLGGRAPSAAHVGSE